MDEIDYLDTIIKPQDCGHLITCRNVLEAHLDQLIKEREADQRERRAIPSLSNARPLHQLLKEREAD
jgi:hypothetical protein